MSKRNRGGGAFVDTAQLDGESSLKPKHSVDETQHMIRNGSVVMVEGSTLSIVAELRAVRPSGCRSAESDGE